MFLIRTRTRRQPKTEGADGRVGRQPLQSVSSLLRTVLRLNSAASTEKEGYGGLTAHWAVSFSASREADIGLRLCLNSAAIFIRMAPAGEQSTGLFSFQPRVKPILN